jgi:hypothetical protein
VRADLIRLLLNSLPNPSEDGQRIHAALCPNLLNARRVVNFSQSPVKEAISVVTETPFAADLRRSLERAFLGLYEVSGSILQKRSHQSGVHDLGYCLILIGRNTE